MSNVKTKEQAYRNRQKGKGLVRIHPWVPADLKSILLGILNKRTKEWLEKQ